MKEKLKNLTNFGSNPKEQKWNISILSASSYNEKEQLIKK